MKIVEIDQRSPEWLTWRKGKIGSSSVPSLFDCGHMTKYEAWLSCLGLYDQPVNSAMQRGIELEAKARGAFEEYHGGIFNPVCIEHPDHPELIASLDGLSLDKNELVEIKCSTNKNYELALKGEIPHSFYIQIQHQLLVSGLQRGWCWCFNGEQGAAVLVPRDEVFIKELFEKEMEFLDQVRKMEPPALSNKDYMEREDKEWTQLAYQYSNVDYLLKGLETQKQELRIKLEELSKGRSCRGGGISLSHGFRASPLPYKQIVQTLGLETKDFEKPPIKVTTIRIEKCEN